MSFYISNVATFTKNIFIKNVLNNNLVVPTFTFCKMLWMQSRSGTDRAVSNYLFCVKIKNEKLVFCY